METKKGNFEWTDESKSKVVFKETTEESYDGSAISFYILDESGSMPRTEKIIFPLKTD